MGSMEHPIRRGVYISLVAFLSHLKIHVFAHQTPHFRSPPKHVNNKGLLGFMRTITKINISDENFWSIWKLEIYMCFNLCVNFEENWTTQCKLTSWQTWHGEQWKIPQTVHQFYKVILFYIVWVNSRENSHIPKLYTFWNLCILQVLLNGFALGRGAYSMFVVRRQSSKLAGSPRRVKFCFRHVKQSLC